ncbi:phage portal protein [Vibrio fluvialis]|uniref:phage portal protein n=1 Tax=Vibrio fluvialis TaxID=676 RepID=UPI001C9D3DE1|nr:phage portal protein [Vibrio fluvialis]
MHFGGVERVNVTNPAHYDGVDYDGYEEYYSPPVDPTALADMMTANSYHGAIVEARARIMVSDFVESPTLSYADMLNICKDLVGFGQCCYQVFYNFLNQPVRLGHAPMLPIRRGKENRFVRLNSDGTREWYKPGEIFHTKMYDPKQTVYGLPDYLSGLQSALLSQDATLFRRRYFKNGQHMGYILYTSDPNLSPKTEEALTKAIQDSRGPGNFRSLYINIPQGQEKGVQIIPVGNSATKDDFNIIKSVSAQDVMVAHRFPPGLGGVFPPEGGSLPDPEKSARMYYYNETRPLHKLLLGVNQILPPGKRIQFDTPDFLKSA